MTSDFQYLFKELPSGGSLFYMWFASMHTRVDVVVCNCNEEQAETAGGRIYREVSRLNALMNRFDPQSQLSEVNRDAFSRPVSVDETLFEVIDIGYRGYEETKGRFDITVPSYPALPNAHDYLLLNPEELSIRFLRPEVVVDLGGIAKGYAADKVAALLRESGFMDFLVNFGNSSIVASGNQPFSEGWSIRLCSGGSDCQVLKDEALSTSGNKHGEPPHILNPLTGEWIREEKEIAVRAVSALRGEIESTVACII